MRRQCPVCRKIIDFKAASCDGCHLSFFSTPAKPKDLTYICVRIAGATLVATVLLAATLLRH